MRPPLFVFPAKMVESTLVIKLRRAREYWKKLA